MKWLFLVHQLQTTKSRERVKVWRLTKKVGAVLHRNSVYVLPYGKERLEDFHWLAQQIRDFNGEASVFVAESGNASEDRALEGLFNATREQDYAILLKSSEQLFKRIQNNGRGNLPSKEVSRLLSKEMAELERNYNEIDRIDYFSAPLKGRVNAMINRTKRALESPAAYTKDSTPVKNHDRKTFSGKTWATREHIHIDRLCSSWLIKRFIDTKAKFAFAPESRLPANAIPFDTFGVEFSHHGEDCTFETLMKAFRIKDKGCESLSQIVHDIDMKDAKFGRTEAPGIDAVVRSLSDSMKDDHKVLEVGFVMLDALHSRLSATKPTR